MAKAIKSFFAGVWESIEHAQMLRAKHILKHHRYWD